MLTKILLVATFVLLSWNSFELSKNNEVMRKQIKELATNDESVEELINSNQTLLKGNFKALEDHTKALEDYSKLSISNQEILNKLATNNKKKSTSEDKNTKVLTGLKTSIDKINTTVAKHSKLLDENKNNIIEIKKTSYKLSDNVIKQFKDLGEKSGKLTTLNYKVSDQVKKLSENSAKKSGELISLNYKILDLAKKQFKDLLGKSGKLISLDYKILEVLKKQSKDLANHSGKLGSLNVCKNMSNNGYIEPAYVKKAYVKPIPLKESKPAATSFEKIAFELFKTKELQNNKQKKDALEQLFHLKKEVSKATTIEDIPADKVTSIISSIEFINEKWKNKNSGYNLDKVEEKINELFFKPGFCK